MYKERKMEIVQKEKSRWYAASWGSHLHPPFPQSRHSFLEIERKRSLTYPVRAGRGERAFKAMSNVDYDNIIHAPGRAASLAEPGQHEQRILITHRASVLPGRLRQLGYRQRRLLARLSRFLVIGGTGVLVNSLALLLLFQWVHLPLVVASVLSAELAIVNNFCWNDRWTFRRTQLSLSRFARFNLVSLGGLVITTCTLWVLIHYLGLYYLTANLLGISLATAWNFAASSLWIWGGA